MIRAYLNIVVVIVILFASCKNTENQETSPLIEEVSGKDSKEESSAGTIQERLRKKIEPLVQDSTVKDFKTDVEPVLFATKSVIHFYSENQYEPVWVNEKGLNKAGEELIKVLSQSEKYGLRSNYYGLDNITDAVASISDKKGKTDKITDIELSLTNAWYLLALHLKEGAVGNNQLLNKNFGSNIPFYAQALQKSLKTNKIGKALDAIQPQDFQYKNLLATLKGFAGQKNRIPKGFSIPDHKSDSLGCMQKVKEALTYQGYLDSTQTTHAQYLEQLKHFQKDHRLEADGVPGPNTRALLLMDNEEKYKRIAMNLDRWRSRQYKFPSEYIFVNIPAFELFWVKGEEVLHRHRVVVGKSITQTPEIISEMNLVVLNPDWSVPQSIIKGEMRNKSDGYLSRYKIYQNGVSVSPGNVRWNAGGIRIVQPPGPTNALGFVKFLFPNNHSVYLHDTPSRALFANSVRAYSHGCVRVQNPLDFALELLQRDGRDYNMDSIQAIISTGVTKNISLKNKMPIYIQYYTAAAIDENHPVFYPDLYKKEEAQASVLFYGKYDKSVDPNKARKAVPSISARPEAIKLPEDSLSLQATP